jgi:hypothetical protein
MIKLTLVPQNAYLGSQKTVTYIVICYLIESTEMRDVLDKQKQIKLPCAV